MTACTALDPLRVPSIDRPTLARTRFCDAPRVAFLAPDRAAEWDEFVRQSPRGSYFHTSGWTSAVRAAFGHSNLTLVARRGPEIVAGLPLMLVHSRIAGRLLISVPYAVYGGALGTDADAIEALRRDAVRLTAQVSARTLELRSERAVWTGLGGVHRYVTFRKPLPQRVEQCLSDLPRKARAAARIARDRHKLVHVAGREFLSVAWRLYAATMRRLGSIAYPYRFFEALMDRSPSGSFVSLAMYDHEPVAGLVTWVYERTAMPYFVGALPGGSSRNAYNFIYLSAMEQAVRLGCHTFDFGRSRVDNHGAVAFKQHQGFAPTPLEYQAYTPPGCVPPDLTPSCRRFAPARRVWPLLPSFVTTPLGGWLSKHIPG